MKCPKCGTSDSSVKETRLWMDGTMYQRRRECFNGHRFATFEVSERLAQTIKKYAEPSAAAVKKVSAYWKRDARIARDVVNGLLIKEAADKYGICAPNVSRIVKRHHPEFNPRQRPRKYARDPKKQQ